MILLPEQCRAARALLGLTQAELAQAAEAGSKTIADFERGAKRQLHTITLRALRNALEAAGIELMDTEGKHPGVRLKKRPKGMVSDASSFTPLLCRVAREFLYISQLQLAETTGLAPMSIADYERGIERRYSEKTLTILQTTLEKSGIEFIAPDDKSGPGVRWRGRK